MPMVSEAKLLILPYNLDLELLKREFGHPHPTGFPITGSHRTNEMILHRPSVVCLF